MVSFLLNLLKIVHHASSEESNGAQLEKLLCDIVPFLGASFQHPPAHRTPVEINNHILHIVYNLCSLDPGRAMTAVRAGLVPCIVRSLCEDWPMRVCFIFLISLHRLLHANL